VKKKAQTLIENPVFPPPLLGVKEAVKKAIGRKSKKTSNTVHRRCIWKQMAG
jgi:hypothetical protein